MDGCVATTDGLTVSRQVVAVSPVDMSGPAPLGAACSLGAMEGLNLLTSLEEVPLETCEVVDMLRRGVDIAASL